MAFNPGVVGRLLSVTPHEDYTAGEINEPDRVLIRRVVNGKVGGAQPHMLSFLSEKWGMGAPRFRTDKVVRWSRKIAETGTAISGGFIARFSRDP